MSEREGESYPHSTPFTTTLYLSFSDARMCVSLHVSQTMLLNNKKKWFNINSTLYISENIYIEMNKWMCFCERKWKWFYGMRESNEISNKIRELFFSQKLFLSFFPPFTVDFSAMLLKSNNVMHLKLKIPLKELHKKFLTDSSCMVSADEVSKTRPLECTSWEKNSFLHSSQQFHEWSKNYPAESEESQFTA